MVTQMEAEVKQAAMLRGLFCDIRDSERVLLYKLYEANIDAKEEDITYREVCAFYHWILTVHSKSREEVQVFLDWIEIAYEDEENLEEDGIWRMEMRDVLPKQFIEKIEHTGFTQIPRGSIMDLTKFVKQTKEKIFSVFAKE